MPPTNSRPASPSTPPQSIPMRDLTRPPDSANAGEGTRGHNRGRSLLSGGSRPVSGGNGPRYERLGDTSPSPTERAHRANPVSALALQRVQDQHRIVEEESGTPTSPVGNPADFQAAMGFAGLLVPDINVSHAPRSRSLTPSYASYGSAEFDIISPYGDGDDHHTYFSSESDTMPLTDMSGSRVVMGLQPSTPTGHAHDKSRSSFQSVSFNTPERSQRSARLGDDLADIEAGYDGGHSRSHSYGNSLTPDGHDGRSRSRSPSSTSGAISRAGSIVRAMSQRVVNMSADAETIEAAARRQAEREAGRLARETIPPKIPSRDPSDDSVPGTLGSMGSFGTIGSLSDESETRYQPKHKKDPLAAGPHLGRALQAEAPVEKAMRVFGGKKKSSTEEEVERAPNPLRGRSLGIFSQDNKIRNKLCDILVYPLTEPIILLLIVAQTVLLAVDASKSVYDNPRPLSWGKTPIDYALLVLFVIFTLEIAARIIVSGFFYNAHEYSTIRQKKGLKNLVKEKYQTVFKPERKPSLRGPRNDSVAAPSITKSFTAMQHDLVKTVEDAQRLQLARRAFMRHSFNRLDLVAVLAFWVAFILGITGIESSFHLYVFRMLSCLRILRLLALTNGTAVSGPFLASLRNLTQYTDHSQKLEKGNTITSERIIPYWLLLASVRHHWSAELQIKS